MRWLWWRHETRDPAAKEALRAAEQAKADVEAQWPTVHRLAESLQAHRDENHFAEMFIRAAQRRGL